MKSRHFSPLGRRPSRAQAPPDAQRGTENGRRATCARGNAAVRIEPRNGPRRAERRSGPPACSTLLDVCKQPPGMWGTCAPGWHSLAALAGGTRSCPHVAFSLARPSLASRNRTGWAQAILSGTMVPGMGQLRTHTQSAHRRGALRRVVRNASPRPPSRRRCASRSRRSAPSPCRAPGARGNDGAANASWDGGAGERHARRAGRAR